MLVSAAEMAANPQQVLQGFWRFTGVTTHGRDDAFVAQVVGAGQRRARDGWLGAFLIVVRVVGGEQARALRLHLSHGADFYDAILRKRLDNL